MVLYDKDEIRKNNERRGKALLILLVLILAVGTMSFLWDDIKPLPQTKECKEEGFEAGKELNSIMFCYNECEGNSVYDCGFRKVLI